LIVFFVLLLIGIALGVFASWTDSPTLWSIFALFLMGLVTVFLLWGISLWVKRITEHPVRAAEPVREPEQRLDLSEQRGKKASNGGAIFIVILVGVFVWANMVWWPDHVANRTATIRQVFLHGDNPSKAPELYMDDGTVWILDGYNYVAMLQGDKVRYVTPQSNEAAQIGAYSSDPDPASCLLIDITTGYRAVGTRFSAPFDHTSCPTK